jgi:ketosteroid isomerase-like protein
LTIARTFVIIKAEQERTVVLKFYLFAKDIRSEQPESTKEDREMASTKELLDHHLKCFGEGDLQGLLSDYAPGAVLLTPDGPLRGADAIKPFFQALFAEFGKPGAAFSMKQESVEGDYAYILWTAETADNVYEVGTDTFVVRDGKVVVQSFAGKIIPKGSVAKN